MGQWLQFQVGINERADNANLQQEVILSRGQRNRRYLGETEPDGDVLYAVLHIKGDDVSVLQALGVEEVGILIHQFVQLRICILLPRLHLDTCHFIGVFLQLFEEDRMQGSISLEAVFDLPFDFENLKHAAEMGEVGKKR